MKPLQLLFAVSLLWEILFLSGCKKEEPVQLVPPVLLTAEISEITQTTALCGGTIQSDGVADILSCGVCWGTEPEAVNELTGNKTSDSLSSENFTSRLEGLIPNTTYYVRAYATSSAGTSYGNQQIFKTLPEEIVTVVTCGVTMINNSGFLIESGNKKVLIDALMNDNMYFEGGGDSYNETILSGNSPFDSIDLFLVTHDHSDHFVANKVASFLEKHSETHFAAPPNCITELKKQSNYSTFSGRVHEIVLTPSTFMNDTINNIPVMLIYTIGHGIHYSYCFTVSSVRCFHAGDISSENRLVDNNYSLLINAMKDIKLDVDFDSRFSSSGDFIQAKLPAYFIPFHYNPTGEKLDIDELSGVKYLTYSNYFERKTLTL